MLHYARAAKAALLLPPAARDLLHHFSRSSLSAPPFCVTSSAAAASRADAAAVISVSADAAYHLGIFPLERWRGAVGGDNRTAARGLAYRWRSIVSFDNGMATESPLDNAKVAIYRELLRGTSPPLLAAVRARLSWLGVENAERCFSPHEAGRYGNCSFSAVHLRAMEGLCPRGVGNICTHGAPAAASSRAGIASCIQAWEPACHMRPMYVRARLAGCARPLALMTDGFDPVGVKALQWIEGAKDTRSHTVASVPDVLLDLLTLALAGCAVLNPASSFTLNTRYLRAAMYDLDRPSDSARRAARAYATATPAASRASRPSLIGSRGAARGAG
eukprot:4148150-Prymnesium_polylepis.1